MANIIVPIMFRVKSKTVKVKALLDTGAEITALSESKAKKIGVRDAGTVLLRGVGGQVTLRLGRVDGVSIPGTRCEVGPMQILIFDRRAFPMGALTGLHSILGLDFMKKAKVKINAFKRTGVVECPR